MYRQQRRCLLALKENCGFKGAENMYVIANKRGRILNLSRLKMPLWYCALFSFIFCSLSTVCGLTLQNMKDSATTQQLLKINQKKTPLFYSVNNMRKTQKKLVCLIEPSGKGRNRLMAFLFWGFCVVS